MHFAFQSEVLVLIRLLLGGGESGYPHLLGILPDFRYWSLIECYESEVNLIN